MFVLVVPPERLNTSHASRDDVRDLRHELCPIDGFFRSDTEFCVAIEQEDRQHHNPGPAVVDQRFPSLWTQRYGTYDDLARVKEWSLGGGIEEIDP